MRGLRAAALIGLGCLALLSCSEPVVESASEPEVDLASSSDACEFLINRVHAAEGYFEENFNPETQIAGCDGGASDTSGVVVLRLNAECRQELCGSVLLGWYAVDVEAGRVWEWDVSETQVGAEITSSPRT